MLFIDKVKKYYPDAVYIASEHDVSFWVWKEKKDNIKNSFLNISKRYIIKI